eukprot:CAMPEP_0172722558 /NCGR_PEP_ID=MMETSP1074-20121228/81777_1 /TAXON_ID=2916 /ORGANISM="Ceratium fusus, Strain PA161109" /LENGTH=155 /DNA_ID=CAMNT_0013548597 /DNA_START=60 /DNA_END=527 /DNA_ORIENTATION=+
MTAILRNVFSLGGFNRSICLATGFAGGYAFTNPDVDNVYDIFPLHKPPPFAFVNVYNVKEEDAYEFEDVWKDLVRFNQKQEGYLFTKMFKADQRDRGFGPTKFQYMDISQWTTGDAQRRATLRASYQSAAEAMEKYCGPKPMMYSVVVDDTPKTH